MKLIYFLKYEWKKGFHFIIQAIRPCGGFPDILAGSGTPYPDSLVGPWHPHHDILAGPWHTLP